MIRTILLLVAADALGEMAHRLLHLPVSGPVLGIVLLLVLFVATGGVPAEAEADSRGLLRLLPLLFVPGGVGVMASAPLVLQWWPAILGALAGSSIVALLATAFTLRAFDRKPAPAACCEPGSAS